MIRKADSFVRQNNNPGAVLNTDNEALCAYKAKKNREKDIDNLKFEVAELKNMIRLVLEKLNSN